MVKVNFRVLFVFPLLSLCSSLVIANAFKRSRLACPMSLLVEDVLDVDKVFFLYRSVAAVVVDGVSFLL